ncbi:MAG: extracellular solute-binding protein [Pseudobacteriovorax sp.]|nr:extracellular solute-binding protein [Pseudobacteriovorax sp.]
MSSEFTAIFGRVFVILLLFATPNLWAKVVMWHGSGDPVTLKKFTELMTSFSEASGIDLDLEYIEYDQMKTSLIKVKTSGRLPEMIFAPGDFLSLMEVLNFSEVKDTLNLPKSSIDSVSQGGKLYGYPITQGNHLFLYYNKKLVTKPAQTFSEILQYSDRTAMRAIGWNFHESFWFLPFYGAYGGQVINDKGEISLTGENFAKAIETYFQLGEKFDIIDCGYDCASKDFFAGKQHYAINGDWALSEAVAQLGDNLGVATLPTFAGRQLKPLFSTKAILFPGNALEGPNRENIMKVVAYMQSASFQKELSKLNLIPAYTDIKGPTHKYPAVIEQLNHVVPMPNYASMNHVWEVLRKGLLRYRTLHKNKDPKRSEKIRKFMEAFLKRSNVAYEKN